MSEVFLLWLFAPKIQELLELANFHFPIWHHITSEFGEILLPSLAKQNTECYTAYIGELSYMQLI